MGVPVQVRSRLPIFNIFMFSFVTLGTKDLKKVNYFMMYYFNLLVLTILKKLKDISVMLKQKL